MKTKFIPLVLAVSLIIVSSFFVFAHVYVVTQLDREHHPVLLPNHPFLLIPQAFALCEPNRDWPDAPCFDLMPVNRQEFKNSWASFYDYKGGDWMESKRTELLAVIANDTFHEWDHSHENSNVYNYYLSIGEVPNQYEYFYFEDEILPDFFGPLIIIGSIIVGVPAIAVFLFRRKRK